MQLHHHILFGKSSWAKLDPLKEYGIDMNKGRETIKYSFTSAEQYGRFLGYEFGFETYMRELVIGDVMMPVFEKFFDGELGFRDGCSMMNYFDEGYQNCIKKSKNEF